MLGMQPFNHDQEQKIMRRVACSSFSMSGLGNEELGVALLHLPLYSWHAVPYYTLALPFLMFMIFASSDPWHIILLLHTRSTNMALLCYVCASSTQNTNSLSLTEIC